MKIQTERLILREINESDIQGIFELDSDPKVHAYLGNNPIKSLAEAKNIVAYIKNQYVENGIGRWAIIDKASNEFVGWSGLKYEKEIRKNFNYYDLGYRIKRKFWNKGIATETAIEALKYGFTTMNLTEIYAAANIDNIGSNKILTKIGFDFVETFEYDGKMHNWYQFNQTDWTKKQTFIH